MYVCVCVYMVGLGVHIIQSEVRFAKATESGCHAYSMHVHTWLDKHYCHEATQPPLYHFLTRQTRSAPQ